jgi:uncharacterized protein (TIGR03083 family)
MTLSTFEQIAAITAHSAGFAASARDNLDAPVEHCPGWGVADLVSHLTGVHWFWATIAEEHAASPPPQSQRPSRAPDERLVDDFVSGAARLVTVLREADQTASCWTWAPQHQDVAFITRHQVQEAAVHHWDAAHAVGRSWQVEPAEAADSVDEFLHVSVSSDADPAEPPGEPLGGHLVLRASDTGDAWALADGDLPGTVRVTGTAGAAAGTPILQAPAADLLLWLYDRAPVDTSAVPADLVRRFQALTQTD